MEEADIALQIKADALLSREELVNRLLADIESAWRAPQAGDAPADRWGLYKEERRRSLRIIAAKRRLATEFGAERGWTLSKKRFGLLALKRATAFSPIRNFADARADELPHCLFDHPYFYRTDRKAVAIAAHLYGVPDNLPAFAAENGIHVEKPDFVSWWYPGATKLVLYTKSGIVGEQGEQGEHFSI